MRLYAVFLRNHGLNPEKDLILVKEGFSWAAFLFTFLWALAGRMWWPAVALFAAVMIAGMAPMHLGLDQHVQGLVSLAVALGIGFMGNDIRRWSLDRSGYQEVALVTGKTREEALRRFLDGADVSSAGIYPGQTL